MGYRKAGLKKVNTSLHLNDRDPSASDDALSSYSGVTVSIDIGDRWMNTSTGAIFICRDNATDAAVWDVSGDSVGHQGFADYNDAATALAPISVVADTWTRLTNDKQGAYTNIAYMPSGVDRFFNEDGIDVSDLSLGDSIVIRYDFTVTPAINGAFLEFRLLLGAGAGEYPLQRPVGTLSNGAGYAYPVTGEILVYMGDLNTRDNPIYLEVKCSESATIVNAGLAIVIVRR